MSKKTFSLSADGEALWARLGPTMGARNESEALERMWESVEASLLKRLDPPALELYRRGLLDREARIEAYARDKARRAGRNSGEKSAPGLAS
jgi:hypothetical protein